MDKRLDGNRCYSKSRVDGYPEAAQDITGRANELKAAGNQLKSGGFRRFGGCRFLGTC